MLASITAVWALALIQAQPTPSLAGVWAEQGGTSRVRISPCQGAPATLCATDLGNGRTAVTGLQPAGNGRWRGRYVADGMNLGANVRMTGPDVAAMTACRLVICQTVTYRRSR